MSSERHPLPVKSGDTNGIVEWISDAIRQIRLTWRLLFDDRVSGWLKLIPPLTLAYVLSPVDILPDVMLGFGQLDDIAVLLIGIKAFIELAPREVVREHLIALGARIEEWRVVNEDVPDVSETVVGELDSTAPDAFADDSISEGEFHQDT
jgi:uncharacterized membrane protein YkvA (DUF1232 family)